MTSSGLADHQEGRGTLKSKFFPDATFTVEYSITFWLGFQVKPGTPDVVAKQADVVHYIRSVDDQEIANGEYELEKAVDSSTEITRLRKTRNGWTTLPSV